MIGDEHEGWYRVSKRSMAAFCDEFGIDPTDVLSSLKKHYSGRRFAALEKAMRESRLVRMSSWF